MRLADNRHKIKYFFIYYLDGSIRKKLRLFIHFYKRFNKNAILKSVVFSKPVGFTFVHS